MGKTIRERFHDIMHYKGAGSGGLIWQLEGISDAARLKWEQDGEIPTGANIGSYLPFDSGRVTLGFGQMPPNPLFDETILEQNGDIITGIDTYGNTRVWDRTKTTTPVSYTYIDGPITTRADFKAFAKRFDPTDTSRVPKHWDDSYFAALNKRETPVSLETALGPGRGAKNYYSFGFDSYMDILAEDEAFVEEVLEFWLYFLMKFLDNFIDKVDIDYFILMEDGMAYKTSVLISPEQFKRLNGKYMKKLAAYLNKKGIDILCYYTSGNIEPYIPVLLDAGFNALAPMEVAAGMDAYAMRQKYGKDLRMMGNISDRALARGIKAVDEEIMPKLTKMWEEGGYIPAPDDMIMPDTSLKTLQHLIQRVKAI